MSTEPLERSRALWLAIGGDNLMTLEEFDAMGHQEHLVGMDGRPRQPAEATIGNGGMRRLEIGGLHGGTAIIEGESLEWLGGSEFNVKSRTTDNEFAYRWRDSDDKWSEWLPLSVEPARVDNPTSIEFRSSDQN